MSELFHRYAPRLSRYVSSRFPVLDGSLVEDVVSTTFEAALRHPDRVLRAHDAGGMENVWGLLRVIGWRTARGVCARAGFRSEIVGLELCNVLGRESGVEVLVHVRLRLSGALDDASEAVLPRDPKRLRAALDDKFATGDSDKEVAARAGVRREHLNRAKRRALRELGLVH